MAEEEESSVEVYVRLRPAHGGQGESDVSISRRFGQQKHVQVRNLEFSLDWVFDESASQEEVFEKVGANLPMLMEGYKVTIMAYGQTGSGKTYTMFGPQEVLERFATSDSSLYGCGPRACYQLFTAIEQSPSAAKWRVECTYLEVYNTAVNDLLTGRKNLILRETAEGGLYVDGLSSEVVDNATDAMAALNRGQTNRVVAAMKMNDRSSRGHAIFSVKMRQEGEGRSVQSRLDLVDLAGMESSKKSYAVEGASNNPMRREESKNINTSLYALGSVVERLSAGGSNHIPFRDSKLTRLLQDSLSGNCSASMIVTLRMEAHNVDESIGTLRFAQRAKAIPVRLRSSSVFQGEVGQLRAQLEDMKKELSIANNERERLQMELDQQVLLRAMPMHTLSTKEVSVDALQKQNRLLRLSLLIRKALSVRQLEKTARLASEHEEVIKRLRVVDANWRSPSQLSGISMISSSTAWKDEGAGRHWAMVSPSKVTRRGVLLTEEERGYKKFEMLATARKMGLAIRGYEVMNVFIDELYDRAMKDRRPETEWNDFLRQMIPSPDAQRPPLTGQSREGSPNLHSRVSQYATLRRFMMPFATSSNFDGRIKQGNSPSSVRRFYSEVQSARGLELSLNTDQEGWRSKVDIGARTGDSLPRLPAASKSDGLQARADTWQTSMDNGGPGGHGYARRATNDALIAARRAAAASADARQAAAKATAAAAVSTYPEGYE